MDINRMRLGLIYIFKESKNLSKQTKLQLINFIEQADEHQLKVLALDGEIIKKESLDDQAKEILDDRFNVNEGVVMLAVAAYIATVLAIAAASHKKRKRLGQLKCEKIADSKKGTPSQYHQCMANAAAQAINEKIAIIKKHMSGCSKTKKPEKCKEKLSKVINKLENEKKKHIYKHTMKAAKETQRGEE